MSERNDGAGEASTPAAGIGNRSPLATDGGEDLAGDSGDEGGYLGLAGADLADAVLLPGDPGRIDEMTGRWDRHEVIAHHREYRTVTGSYEGTPISATSTGVGSASAALAIEELARAGAGTLIRVGSCGGIQPEIDVGDLVITTGAVRQEGTTDEYVREDYPAVADGEVVSALVAAAERLDHDYHVGPTMTADSFHAGQGRPGFGGYEAPGTESLLAELRAANVKNIEMEASAVLTLSTLYGLRAGAVCAVYADRTTGEFRPEGEAAAVAVASLAVHLLARMDEVKQEHGADRWHAGLSL